MDRRPTITLASGSSRRKDLLTQVGISASVIVPHIEELHLDGETPREMVARLAASKWDHVAANNAGVAFQLIIAADTLVVVDGEILGKPTGRDDARRMLLTLSGTTHEVLTAVSVGTVPGNQRFDGIESTTVVFRNLSEQLIDAYLDTGEYSGRAGGCCIEGAGACLVSEIRGSYENVVGLPLAKLDELVGMCGFSLSQWFVKGEDR